MRVHIDLFAGIGGNSFAADSIWDDIEHIFCEIDPFCQEVLKKHWHHSKIYDDIKKFNGTPAYLVTGGFPCQPFSQAGKRKGKEDDRWLWPEMLRVIRESNPDWVIGENVAGFIGMALDEVLSDLEGIGYEVRPFVIPAVAVNAPHRRDRVWIVAHNKRIGRMDGKSRELTVEREQALDATSSGSRIASNTTGERTRGKPREIRGTDGRQDDECVPNIERTGERVISNTEYYGRNGAENAQSNPAGSNHNKKRADELRQPQGTDSVWEDVTNARREYGQSGRSKKHGQDTCEWTPQTDKAERCSEAHVADSAFVNEKRRIRKGTLARKSERPDRNRNWDEDWTEVATRLCRVDDGVSRELDIAGLREYAIRNGQPNESKTAEACTASNPSHRLRILRVYIKVAEASSQGTSLVGQGADTVPAVPHEGGVRERDLGAGKKEEDTVRDMPQVVSTDSHGKEQDLLKGLPLGVGEAKRILAVATQRNPRLKALGNTIVPQVATEIMRAIKEIS